LYEHLYCVQKKDALYFPCTSVLILMIFLGIFSHSLTLAALKWLNTF